MDGEVDNGETYHCHVCHGCAHLWWHKKSDGERRAIHLCPECGSGPYYFGYNTRRDAEEDRKWLRSQLT